MTNKIKDILQFIGFLGSIIMTIAYLIAAVVMIVGIEQKMDPSKQTLFSILSAVIGLSISIMLRGQGVIFAKNEPKSKEVMKTYNEAVNKTKKTKNLHTITWFMMWSLVGDIFTKLITMAASTYLVIFIFSEGNGDWSLIGLALTNILMFICFGLLALNKAYDKYLNEHIPIIEERTKRIKEGRNNEV